MNLVLKEFKFGFNIYGLLLFLIIMIPNFIWFAVPAPNDVLRTESVTEVIDTITSVCQVLMVIALCIFVTTSLQLLNSLINAKNVLFQQAYDGSMFFPVFERFRESGKNLLLPYCLA